MEHRCKNSKSLWGMLIFGQGREVVTAGMMFVSVLYLYSERL